MCCVISNISIIRCQASPLMYYVPSSKNLPGTFFATGWKKLIHRKIISSLVAADECQPPENVLSFQFLVGFNMWWVFAHQAGCWIIYLIILIIKLFMYSVESLLIFIFRSFPFWHKKKRFACSFPLRKNDQVRLTHKKHLMMNICCLLLLIMQLLLPHESPFFCFFWKALRSGLRWEINRAPSDGNSQNIITVYLHCWGIGVARREMKKEYKLADIHQNGKIFLFHLLVAFIRRFTCWSARWLDTNIIMNMIFCLLD